MTLLIQRAFLVTLRIGDAAAYRTGEEAADATNRKTATKKGTSGPVTGSKASEVPQGDASAATRAASSTDGQAAHDPRSTKMIIRKFYGKNQYCKKTYNTVGPPTGQ
jgi:hypothetical protein